MTKAQKTEKSFLNYRKKKRNSYFKDLNETTEIYFYLYFFTDGYEHFYKIGVSKKPEARYKAEKEYKHFLIAKYKAPREDIWNIETYTLLRILRNNLKYKPKKPFAGETECFNAVGYEKVISVFTERGCAPSSDMLKLIRERYLNHPKKRPISKPERTLLIEFIIWHKAQPATIRHAIDPTNLMKMFWQERK